MNKVLDTNIAIYFLQGRLAEPLAENSYSCSVITEMELLSHPALNQSEEDKVKIFLAELKIIGLEEEIKKTAIQLRKHFAIKLPDAIIAATAITLDTELLSNDQQMIAIPGLRCRNLKLKTLIKTP